MNYDRFCTIKYDEEQNLNLSIFFFERKLVKGFIDFYDYVPIVYSKYCKIQ